MTNSTYKPSVTLLPIDEVLLSSYRVTEPYGLLWEKHLIKRVASYGVSYCVVSKLGTEMEKIHKSWKRKLYAHIYYIDLEMETE